MTIIQKNYRTRKNKSRLKEFKGDTSVYDILRASYADGKESKQAIERLTKQGYVQDIDLSNRETKIFYHPEKGTGLATFSGSRSPFAWYDTPFVSVPIPPLVGAGLGLKPLKGFKEGITDWLYTDAMLGVGRLKDTSRYKSSKETLEKARAKYNPKKFIVAGHSLGGTLASFAGRREDKIVTYNKGVTIGQKNRSNELALRQEGDLVSILGVGLSSTTTIADPKNFWKSPWAAHDVGLLRHRNFTV